MPSPLIEFPLPAWPREAFPFEPAHGYFRRLAAANAQVSVRTLGSYVGVNGRNFDREELLEFCSRFPSSGIENLKRFTPKIEGPIVTMNGELISRKKDYIPYHPRACPSCLQEAYYYRNWFDLSAVGFCPVHGEPLCDLNAGEQMAWWQASLGQPLTLRCSTVAPDNSQRSLDWEKYVLGRMGVVEPHPNVVLDTFTLAEVIAGCVLLGTDQIARAASSAERRAVGRHDAAAAGFACLRKGVDGVRAFFVAKAERAALTDGCRGTTVDGSFGWVASAIKRNLSSGVGDLCMSGLNAAIDQLSLYSRSSRLDPTTKAASNLTLTDLADRTGLPRRKVRLIAHKMGLVPTARTGSQTYWFAPAQVQAFEGLLADLMCRKDAAAALGLSGRAFGALLVHLGLPPYTRLGEADPAADRFLGSEIRGLLDRIARQAVLVNQPGIGFEEFCRRSDQAPADVAWAILQGRQTVTCIGDTGFAGIELPVADVRPKAAHEPKPRRSSRLPGISFADAASRLGVAQTAIPGLVEAGLLTEQDVAGRVRRIVGSSLDDFDSRYAAVVAYARALNLSPKKATADFQAAGVSMLRREGRQKVVWADRASVIATMGQQWDLTKLDEFSSAIWNAFQRYLSETGSPNRLVNAVGASARLRSGSGFTLLHLSTDSEGQSLTVSASAVQKSSPAWFELLKAHEDHIREIWPQATVHSDPVSIAFTQVHAIGSEAPASGLAAVVAFIEQIATRLRMLRLMEVTEASPVFSVEQAA